jgi:hypothetical protein
MQEETLVQRFFCEELIGAHCKRGHSTKYGFSSGEGAGGISREALGGRPHDAQHLSHPLAEKTLVEVG